MHPDRVVTNAAGNLGVSLGCRPRGRLLRSPVVPGCRGPHALLRSLRRHRSPTPRSPPTLA
eukprot:1551284-Pyramimonas_sp.AAC.1